MNKFYENPRLNDILDIILKNSDLDFPFYPSRSNKYFENYERKIEEMKDVDTQVSTESLEFLHILKNIFSQEEQGSKEKSRQLLGILQFKTDNYKNLLFSKCCDLRDNSNNIQVMTLQKTGIRLKSSSSEINLKEQDYIVLRKIQSEILSPFISKNMTLQCVCDLNDIKVYLQNEDLNNINSSVENLSVDEQLTSGHAEKCTGGESCRCPGYHGHDPVEITLDDNDQVDQSSSLIICINGVDGEDGKIKIVLKRCAECKEAENHKSAELIQTVTQTKLSSEEEITETVQEVTEIKPSTELKISKTKPPTEQDRSGLNIILNSDEPSKSVIEAKEMSRIKLNETVNLSVCTENNEEFVISLKIARKSENSSKPINVTDLFSDEDNFKQEKRNNVNQTGNQRPPQGYKLTSLKPTESDQTIDFIDMVNEDQSKQINIPDLITEQRSSAKRVEDTTNIGTHSKAVGSNVSKVNNLKQAETNTPTETDQSSQTIATAEGKHEENNSNPKKIKKNGLNNPVFQTTPSHGKVDIKPVEETVEERKKRDLTAPPEAVRKVEKSPDKTSKKSLTRPEQVREQTRKTDHEVKKTHDINAKSTLTDPVRVTPVKRSNKHTALNIPRAVRVCSSMNFDITVAPSRIRKRGFINKNRNVTINLTRMGTDNVLRACRPVKCGRLAILDEKLVKELPYSVSLRSLPLNEDDIAVIEESLLISRLRETP